ncbi:flagellar basal-body rod protein FlgF [Desulfovibrio aminophilus]|uniref:flagellar basal-body rod protein FlgF n=1 Tax=Desulfovibrio aminophilus TaxID=81425 RepID=UPI0004059D6F|nr:flagellar basal-body rod protein FlgF [Desulfovibrio aminophilus]
MRDSTYSALFGAMSNEHKLGLIANNLANANTTGYKKDQVAFHDTFQRFAHDYLVDSRSYLRDKNLWPKPDVMAKPRLSEQRTDFSQGSLQMTGNPLDLAISGEGFFKLRTPDGDFLTRSGSFQLTAEGGIISEQGYELLGQGGPLLLPGAGNVIIDSQGQVSVDGAVTNILDVVTVDDPTALEKVGNNLYRVRPGAKATETPVPPETRVEQGYIEKANVEVVTEMVAMIEVQRAFEMYQRMISGTSEMDRTVTDKVGSVV